MSVMIKGINPPSSCKSCRLVAWNNDVGFYCGVLSDNLFKCVCPMDGSKRDDCPSVDVEPVRHGSYKDEPYDEWYGAAHICDKCGEAWMGMTNYCPNCGAKMDGKERKPFMINKECYLEPTVDKNGIPCMAIRKVKEQEHE